MYESALRELRVGGCVHRLHDTQGVSRPDRRARAVNSKVKEALAGAGTWIEGAILSKNGV